MENTWEIRWFLRGSLPSVVQDWFQLKCPGEVIPQSDRRKDLYIYKNQPNYIDRLRNSTENPIDSEEINLKFRQGSLELKLRQQQFGRQNFGRGNGRPTWIGSIEQWSKLSLPQPNDSSSFTPNSIEADCISVEKKRSQKIDLGVKSELTQLEARGSNWWTIAFEMPLEQDNSNSVSLFREAVQRAAETYYGPKLSADRSCGYSRWLINYVLMPQEYQN